MLYYVKQLETFERKIAQESQNDDDLEKIDPQVLRMTRLTTEMVHELMWDLGRPGAVADMTLMTRIEDATEMLGDVLSSLPESEEE